MSASTKKLGTFHNGNLARSDVEQIECPFREFRDNELSPDYWGMSTSAIKTALLSKVVVKPTADHVWIDEQTQPLPRSVRQYLHGWVRAEDLALSRWGEAEIVVFEENGTGKMSIMDMQLSHTQVLQRSSFCRRVLSACYILEKIEPISVEHQWESFSFPLPEGWRAKYHIYSPGIKPGGGLQHRPGLSKNGCYLVRLYYLGAWRCVWVNDQVPVDAMGAPLLPFSPLLSPVPAKSPQVAKQQAPAVAVTAAVVHLWPLLLCKALLKLAAPDMNSDEETESIEDELMPDFKIMHTFTGAMEMEVSFKGLEDLWDKLAAEVTLFSWEEDDETVKSKSVKKPSTKESAVVKRGSMAILTIEDTKELPPYSLPGITPGHEMGLYVYMARDLPLKKPLPEPEVALWKYYRWVDWARSHGLYEAYSCPRTRFLKLTGFLKMSYAPHLLDVQSTETITLEFRKAHEHDGAQDKKGAAKDVGASNSPAGVPKEELREWVLYDNVAEVAKQLTVVYLPSMYNFTSTGSSIPVRVTKVPMNRALDIQAPKSSPLYLQIDAPEAHNLKISINMLHPRVMMNCGAPVLDYIEPAYVILEVFEWFVDTELPKAKAYMSTRGYNTVEVKFLPGRHFCRLWVHSRMQWHMALLSESSILLGHRDQIQGAAVRECPWAIRFLSNVGTAFTNMLRVPKSTLNFNMETDFYTSYQPDLTWDEKVVGYKKNLLHWMFRNALQSLLKKRLIPNDYRDVCVLLRRYLLAPDFGLSDKKPDTTPYREIMTQDPCDCKIPEPEVLDESLQSEEMQAAEEPVRHVSETILAQLLVQPSPPVFSQVCELATDELPCGVLKEEREKMVRKHEAATVLQAYWRGYRTRQCLTAKVNVTQEIFKNLMECAFGTPEALSALMNEFFILYPGAKYAYSVASALTGTTGLQNFSGIAPISPQDKWIPYFQGVFYCHDYVKVHFALHSNLQFNTVAVYDNDTGLQLPQAFRAHITFDIQPNIYGYTVMGQGSLMKPITSTNSEAHWQLTVLSSISDVFHVCDNNDSEYCHEIPLPPASKLHINEIFVPNRRNILGGIKLIVLQNEAVSFRAAASSPEVDLVATLRVQTEDGDMEIVDQCSGQGELFWPYIKVEPPTPQILRKMPSISRSCTSMSTSQLKKPRQAAGGLKKSSTTKVKGTASVHGRLYTIELTCPDGWPLTLDQWRRVEELRNTTEPLKVEPAVKKPPPAKATPSARDKFAPPPVVARVQPQPGDAYAELECALALGGGITALRDDEREVRFEMARRTWEANEPGRNHRGAQIRKEFRDEFLVAPSVPPIESARTTLEEITFAENEGETSRDTKNNGSQRTQVCPSPVTETGILEMSVESEEEAKYLNLPEQLKDKFISLPFISLCLKEVLEDHMVVITPAMSEAGKADRHLRIDAAINHMYELQEYNKLHVLRQQKERCMLLDKLFIDGSWTPDLHQVLEGRDEAITQEALARTLSATKKKMEQKKK